MKILVFGQRAKEEDLGYVATLIKAATERSLDLCIYGPYDDELASIGFTTSIQDKVYSYKDLKSERPDTVVTLGGDGTILKAITLIKELGIPILGINLGRLGFLASVEKKNIEQVVSDLAGDKYDVEERSLLSLECNLPIFGDTRFALNDFTITKRDNSSMITIKTYIDDQLMNTYWADGIIVATPTGSTGYSLSCDGPIVFPESSNFVITPIAPHNLNVRPVVISDSKNIRFEIEGRAENFLTTLDSRFETITKDHIITISKADFSIKLVHPEGSTFMQTIRSKLLWGLDMRN